MLLQGTRYTLFPYQYSDYHPNGTNMFRNISTFWFNNYSKTGPYISGQSGVIITTDVVGSCALKNEKCLSARTRLSTKKYPLLHSLEGEQPPATFLLAARRCGSGVHVASSTTTLPVQQSNNSTAAWRVSATDAPHLRKRAVRVRGNAICS